jgi:hypothetical protein
MEREIVAQGGLERDPPQNSPEIINRIGYDRDEIDSIIDRSQYWFSKLCLKL